MDGLYDTSMDSTSLPDDYLNRLRRWRNRPDPDLTLGFLRKQFDQGVRRPYERLQSITELWRSMVPTHLILHTQLLSMTHGILRVSVDSSAHLYQLDRLLRSGLERQLVIRHKGPALRRVRLQLSAGQTAIGR